jgi:hypothetical protein
VSGTDSWCTPKWLADLLGRFDLDPCSNERSHVQADVMLQLEPTIAPENTGSVLDDMAALGKYLKRRQGDGLAHEWGRSSTFVNPPYSNPLPWALKLRDHEGPWCALLKLDPSTRWWAALMDASPTVAPFRKRIKFEGAPGEPTMTANFPSVLVYSAWRPSRPLAEMLWLPTWTRAAPSAEEARRG